MHHTKENLYLLPKNELKKTLYHFDLIKSYLSFFPQFHLPFINEQILKNVQKHNILFCDQNFICIFVVLSALCRICCAIFYICSFINPYPLLHHTLLQRLKLYCLCTPTSSSYQFILSNNQNKICNFTPQILFI